MQTSEAHDEPLLRENSYHDRFGDRDNDLERIDGVSGGFSHRSSLEMTDAPFEQIPLREGPSWTAHFYRHASSLASRVNGRKRKSTQATRNGLETSRLVMYLIAIALMMSGVLQLLFVSFLTVAAFSPNSAAYFIGHWGDPARASKRLLHWPTDFSQDIQPVPCHSHNDYWRKIPLHSALQAGCMSVEADVWLVEEDLYVGHSTSSLTSHRTLKSLYINPLLDILAKQNPKTKFHPGIDSPPNGVFDTNFEQALVLLIDFKTDGHDLWPYVSAQLDPLREAGYLTFFDGASIIKRPLIIVASGNAPFDLVISNSTYRDIFFDAPLDRISPEDTSNNVRINPSPYNTTNSYFASTGFGSAIGTVWFDPSTTQFERIRAQISAAHDQGLKARYWETPAWPRGLRNHVWNVLVEEGADFLNVDDLKAATEGNWGEWN